MDSTCKMNTHMRPFYLYNGKTYTGKMAFSYWVFCVTQIFYGLDDRELVEAHAFEEPFHATAARIVLQEWESHPCMRFDFEACPG